MVALRRQCDKQKKKDYGESGIDLLCIRFEKDMLDSEVRSFRA